MDTVRELPIVRPITPTTTVVTKRAPPRTLLSPTSPTPDPAVKETILEKKSGAPFPNERSVTPAMAGESLRTFERLSSEEQKYSEAVLPSR